MARARPKLPRHADITDEEVAVLRRPDLPPELARYVEQLRGEGKTDAAIIAVARQELRADIKRTNKSLTRTLKPVEGKHPLARLAHMMNVLAKHGPPPPPGPATQLLDFIQVALWHDTSATRPALALPSPKAARNRQKVTPEEMTALTAYRARGGIPESGDKQFKDYSKLSATNPHMPDLKRWMFRGTRAKPGPKTKNCRQK